VKHRILIIIIAFCFSLALCACNGNRDDSDATSPTQESSDSEPITSGSSTQEPAASESDSGQTNISYDQLPNEVRVDATQLYAELNTNTWFICDVRLYAAHVVGHVPGSVNIPLKNLERRIAEIPRDKPIILVADDGREAYEARQLLIELGLDGNNLRVLDGGMGAWEAAGFPVSEILMEKC